MIARRTAAVAAVTVVPLVAAVELWAPPGAARWFALLWGLAAIVGAWLAGWSLSARANDLAHYAAGLPDAAIARPRLRLHDDELGDLARTLQQVAPKVERIVQGLSTELARREAILASMNEAVLAVDARLNVSFCNESFVRAAGHRVPEGVPLIRVFRNPALFQILRQVIDSGETIRQQLSVSGQDDRSFEVHAAPLNGSTERGALAMLHDITPMARIERAHRDFVANVSHELRTPLATIAGCAETLLYGAWDDVENRRKFLETIQATSTRLTNIAADLITLSQIDAGAVRAEPAPITVDEVVSSAVRAIEPVAGARGIRVREEEICAAQVLGHRIAFEQVLVNLLDNAIKFNRPAGEVVIRAAMTGDQVELSVADNGIGIPAEDFSRVFERFYRVDKARSRQMGGTGLGLSIVRQAVEQMHGTVRVESQLGNGSCFTIVLPRYQGSASS